MNWMLLALWVLYPFLKSSQGGYLICTDSSSGDSCPQCFCPNNAIKYTCELERLESTTRWTVPPNLCTQPGGNNWIQLSQAAGCGGNRVTCGAFVAANVAVNGSETPCSVSQLEVTITDQMARARVQCSSINLKGVSLERYESAPITMTRPSLFVFAPTISSNDSVTVAWRLLPSPCNHSDNFTVLLSNDKGAVVSSGVLSYKFSGLAPDTCYDVTIIANSCSGSGMPISALQCTTANPPTGVIVSIIVQRETKLPVQLQVVWNGHNGSSGYRNYSVTINRAEIKAVSRNYAIWPIAVIPSYFVVSVSSITQAGKGRSSPNTNISGSIHDSDIVNATLIDNTTVSCKFSSLDSHHCLMCCSTDPAVPPDSSVYNISSTSGTDVTVVLAGLIAHHVYYCKVAATDDTEANCFSSVYRGIQTLIRIVIPGQIPAESPLVTSVDSRTVSISVIATISVVVVMVCAISMVAISVIVRHKCRREQEAFCNKKKHFTEDVLLQQSASAHVYEEVTPNVAPSGVQDAGAGASYECVQDSVIDRSFCANQSEGEYLTVGQRVNDSVASPMPLDAEHIVVTPHVYAILESRDTVNESNSEEEC